MCTTVAFVNRVYNLNNNQENCQEKYHGIHLLRFFRKKYIFKLAVFYMISDTIEFSIELVSTIWVSFSFDGSIKRANIILYISLEQWRSFHSSPSPLGLGPWSPKCFQSMDPLTYCVMNPRCLCPRGCNDVLKFYIQIMYQIHIVMYSTFIFSLFSMIGL